MDIFLDSERFEPAREGLAGALESGGNTASNQGRMLTRVIADGAPIDPGLLDQPPTGDAGISVLELFSEEPSVVLLESLQGASAALESVKADQISAADQIQSGQIAESFEPLARVLQTWATVRQIVGQAGELAQIDIGRLQIESAAGTVTGAALIADLTLRLESIREAMGREDWGGLSDELGYELGTQADSWRGLVHAMANQIDGSD